MAESFFKTISRDYVYRADCDSAATILKLLLQWFADHNNVDSQLEFGMKSPVESKESVTLKDLGSLQILGVADDRLLCSFRLQLITPN